MNAVALPPVATQHEGGFYAGRIRIDAREYALIVAPKTDGDHAPAIWIPRDKDVPGARSLFDGMANTRAMAEAGSKVAAWALALSIGGFTDWYLPALYLGLCSQATRGHNDRARFGRIALRRGHCVPHDLTKILRRLS